MHDNRLKEKPNMIILIKVEKYLIKSNSYALVNKLFGKPEIDISVFDVIKAFDRSLQPLYKR